MTHKQDPNNTKKKKRKKKKQNWKKQKQKHERSWTWELSPNLTEMKSSQKGTCMSRSNQERVMTNVSNSSPLVGLRRYYLNCRSFLRRGRSFSPTRTTLARFRACTLLSKTPPSLPKFLSLSLSLSFSLSQVLLLCFFETSIPTLSKNISSCTELTDPSVSEKKK